MSSKCGNSSSFVFLLLIITENVIFAEISLGFTVPQVGPDERTNSVKNGPFLFSNFLDIFSKSTIILFPSNYMVLPSNEISKVERIIREIIEFGDTPIIYYPNPPQNIPQSVSILKHRNGGGSKTYIFLRRYSSQFLGQISVMLFYRKKFNPFQDYLVFVLEEVKRAEDFNKLTATTTSPAFCTMPENILQISINYPDETSRGNPEIQNLWLLYFFLKRRTAWIKFIELDLTIMQTFEHSKLKPGPNQLSRLRLLQDEIFKTKRSKLFLGDLETQFHAVFDHKSMNENLKVLSYTLRQLMSSRFFYKYIIRREFELIKDLNISLTFIGSNETLANSHGKYCGVLKIESIT